MVTEWGMSDKLGMIAYGDNSQEVFLGHSVTQSKNVSEATAREIDAEIKQIIDSAYARAKRHPDREPGGTAPAGARPAGIRDAVGRRNPPGAARRAGDPQGGGRAGAGDAGAPRCPPPAARCRRRRRPRRRRRSRADPRLHRHPCPMRYSRRRRMLGFAGLAAPELPHRAAGAAAWAAAPPRRCRRAGASARRRPGRVRARPRGRRARSAGRATCRPNRSPASRRAPPPWAGCHRPAAGDGRAECHAGQLQRRRASTRDPTAPSPAGRAHGGGRRRPDRCRRREHPPGRRPDPARRRSRRACCR